MVLRAAAVVEPWWLDVLIDSDFLEVS